MPQINVRLFAAAREAFGTKELTVSAATLEALVASLTDDAGLQGRTVISRSSFLVNSVAATDRGLALAEGDTVDVLPPFAGG